MSGLATRAERLGGWAGKLILLILAGGAAPVEARVWGSPAGWVVQDFPEACGMERKFEGAGNTAMSVTWHVDLGVLLHVSNFKWPIKKGDKFEVIVEVDGRALERRATAYEQNTRKGFGMFLREEHVDAIAAGARIDFRRADTKFLVDSLRLDGTGAAVALMRRCLVSVKARVAKERRENGALAHGPATPFADPAIPGSAIQTTPLTSVPSLISDEDYPASAIRANEQGRTGYRLTVGTNGRVTGCTVTSSSGSATLDSTTCRILRARARFTPARDAQGEPVEAFHEGVITWSLHPPDPAVPPNR